MTIFEEFQSKNIDELAEWLDEYCMFDYAPWTNWFDETYCKNCEPEIIREEDTECLFGMEYSWCELHGKCKRLQNIIGTLDNKQIIKLWLEREV